ncbi:MAG: hypothetical protein NTV16_01535 [Actinobacteria bacterium]|nr:hypothetical protein [Actinomycetota bacterium]
MDIGCIFKWNKFPYQKDGVIKDRYFIYLGKTPIFSITCEYHLFTTTHELQYYNDNGNRVKNKFIRLKKDEFKLPLESVLDLDVGLHSISENKIIDNKNIEILDYASEEFIKRVYVLILESGFISTVVKMDIYETLNRNGIFGLEKPKRHK